MPLLWLSLAFLAGVVLAATLRLPGVGWILLAAAALIWPAARWLVLRLSKRAASGGGTPPEGNSKVVMPVSHGLAPLPLFALLAALALGAARYQYALPDLADPGFVAAYNDQDRRVEVEGILVEPPDVRDRYANLRLRAERLRPLDGGAFVPVSGLVLARASAGSDWQYGDRLRLRGRLETPPEDEEFSYRDYLARQGVYSYIDYAAVERVGVKQGNRLLTAIYALRERALDLVYRLFPDPEASLLAGILLGVESGIPADVKQAFQDTGTAHVIAISGLNPIIIYFSGSYREIVFGMCSLILNRPRYFGRYHPGSGDPGNEEPRDNR